MDTRETPEKRAAVMEGVAFVGETLAPFFLQDPATGEAGASFAAVAALDADAAAREWPFAEEADAHAGLSLMVAGLEPEAAGASEEGMGAYRHDGPLAREYRRLFIGPAPKPAPPWGSVYTDRECVVFGETTLELRTWMRLNGIARATDDHTPEDHIGLMLALLAYLAREKPEIVAEFLKLHLLTWSSHFLGELEDAAEQPFYRGLAHLTRASLEGMQAALGIEVTYPRFYR
ncbi:MAG: Tat proofreading chaperone DmsD [Coriobacteriia bacterium]|nr:Tat proofreading chaperone DmsD [Coriobacteriia bacterium]MBS5477851.1 Tat proofreading chaperone DmsD [Coriobacteriia bacterium]